MPRPKPHFKVFLAMMDPEDDHVREVYRDNDLLSFYVRLGMKAIDRGALENGGEFAIRESELVELAGVKKRADIAIARLNRLCEVSPISARYRGNAAEITIPNLLKWQRFGSGNGTRTEQERNKNGTSKGSTKGQQELIPAPQPPSASPKGQRRFSTKTKRSFPDPFPDEMREALYEWAASHSCPGGCSHNFDRQMVDYAIARMTTQAQTTDPKAKNWYQALQGYMMDGWILRGYQPTAKPSAAVSAVQGVLERSRRRDEQQVRNREGHETAGGRLPLRGIHEDET